MGLSARIKTGFPVSDRQDTDQCFFFFLSVPPLETAGSM
uniref:Uncharacterized protein n=1 Tax=Anguilla anguilla TaxID=7936 RepID=A0A0E9S1J9_ANGAN